MSTLLATACLRSAFKQYVPKQDFLSVILCSHILIRIAVPRPSNAGMVAEDQIYANSLQQFDVANFDFHADPSWPMQSAFDINLGEFMLDTDMQFLNNYFRKDGLGSNAPTLAPG